MPVDKKNQFNNKDFMNMMKQSTAKSVKKAEEQKNKVNISDKENDLQHIDIDLMDDAPDEMNTYPRLKDDQPDKYLELKLSMFNKGVLTPLFLLDNLNGRYMVIAGHNRRDICREIIIENKDEPGFELDKYKYVPCTVKRADELSEQEIQDMIDDTNCQRDISKLSQQTQIILTKRRLDYYKRNRYSKGASIDQMARELGLKKTSIYDNIALSEKVIPEFQKLYYDQKLTRKAALKFTFFDKEEQEWMKDKFEDRITEEKVNGLKKKMGRDDIEKLFNGEGVEIKKMTIEIPSDRVAEFKELLKQFLNAGE